MDHLLASQRNIVRVIFILFPGIALFAACWSNTSRNANAISTDVATIARGEKLFLRNCTGCHNFQHDGIGPQLGGLTDSIPAEWIENFVKAPSSVIASGDERAQRLSAKFKQAVMPSFGNLRSDELKAIVAYINSRSVSGRPVAKVREQGLTNPIPGVIGRSGLTVYLKQFAVFPPSATDSPLARITKLDFQPNTGILFVNDLRGKLYKLKGDRPVVFLDIARTKPGLIPEPGLGTGFGSFAFHPDFAHNGLLYTTHAEARGGVRPDFGYADSIKVSMQWVLCEWKMNNPNADVFSGTCRELLRIDVPYVVHGIQEISFRPNAKKGDEDYGLLYVAVGEGGSVELGYPFLPHSKERVLGTILRIDPQGHNSANKQYGIPGTNPFVKEHRGKELGEIYAYGFRNPHRMTWTESGKMLVSNIGEANIEAIDLVEPGLDYGWPLREGRFVLGDPATGNVNMVYPLPSNDSIYHFTYPIAEYDHDEGHAIAGGYEYRGQEIAGLKGKFLFGDIPTGRLFYIDARDIRQGRRSTIREWAVALDGPTTLKKLCGNNRVDLHFGRDSKGEMYILTKADGKLYKLVSAVE